MKKTDIIWMGAHVALKPFSMHDTFPDVQIANCIVTNVPLYHQ